MADGRVESIAKEIHPMEPPIVTFVLFACMLSLALHTFASDPGALRLVLDDQASPVDRRVADIFAAEVYQRTGRRLASADGSNADHSLVLRTDSATGLGADGFRLATAPDSQGRMFVTGESPGGLAAGVGKLLRMSRYAPGSIAIPAIKLEEAPKMPVRGMYFATHFHNFYHVAPLAEVDRVIEELALWGGNVLNVWFDMHHFNGLRDPAAQKHLARLKHFAETAHGVGMQFGMGFLGNEGYGNSPKHLRATRSRGIAAYGVEVCPATPEGLALIGKWQAELLDAFPRIDVLWSWPYDQGGCACESCHPWGGNGFLRCSEQMAKLYHERFPNGRLWMSTWDFDAFEGHDGDYDGLFRLIREGHPEWLTGLLGGARGPYRRVFERPDPQRYPLTWFPEISMHGMSPWGGCGANPLPGRCHRIMSEVGDRIVGGWPYSEGIYEDLNKFLWLAFFWNPGRPVDDLLHEYAAHYLAPDVAEDGVKLLRLLEKTHYRSQWAVRNLEEADEAHAVAQGIDAALPEWAKVSWRWRVLYIRATIDHVLKNHGFVSGQAQALLNLLCEEICRIYHVQSDTRGSVRPPKSIRRDPNNLAYDKALVVSSTHPEYVGSERQLVDGIRSEYDTYNFWVHDPSKEKTATVTIDLGQSHDLREAGLQFRNIRGVYWFIPQSVTFEVSDDGIEFAPATTSTSVPKEGGNYSSALWRYAIGKRGRYLRVRLGPSQHTGDRYSGLLELTEIEVYVE